MHRFLIPLVLLLILPSCMKWDYGLEEDDFDAKGFGLFILNEGNFQYGNATLSYYDPKSGEVLNEVFLRANGMRLGDVAQSMQIYDNKGWIVVNNSHVVFAINPNSFKEIGRIENLTSPRYIHFVNKEKAYVTQIWDNRIFIINPQDYSVTGYITVPGMEMESGSTEQMVQIGRYVYCTCWSYQNSIIKIDTEIDEVVGQLTVGLQPKSLVADCFGKLWTITDGGYEGSPQGYEAPTLWQIDPESLEVVKLFPFKTGETPFDLQTNGAADSLYWINDGVWKMGAEADRLPVSPIIESMQTKFYALTVNPKNGDIYVADAIDYQQQGAVYRFSPEGSLTDEFYVGVTPGSFCWK